MLFGGVRIAATHEPDRTLPISHRTAHRWRRPYPSAPTGRAFLRPSPARSISPSTGWSGRLN